LTGEEVLLELVEEPELLVELELLVEVLVELELLVEVLVELEAVELEPVEVLDAIETFCQMLISAQSMYAPPSS